MKKSTDHHKRVRVPFSTVEHGYDGNRQIRQAGPGLWQIIGADPVPTPGYAQHPAYHGTIALIVAPAVNIEKKRSI